jgi:hypothetical protein
MRLFDQFRGGALVFVLESQDPRNQILKHGRTLTNPDVPGIFPTIGPATRFVLFTDFLPKGRVPTSGEWLDECSFIVDEGLSGVALRRIRNDSLAVPSVVLGRFRKRHFDSIAQTALVLNQSKGGLDALRSAGIAFAITKGLGIAMHCESPEERPCIDVDVVVEPRNFEAARSVLAQAGYEERERSVQPWRSFDRFCREAVNLRNESGGSIDLHHRISPWFWSTGLEPRTLIKSASLDTGLGAGLPMVSPKHNLLIIALHIVSDKSRPGQTVRTWRDLMVMVNHCSTDGVVTTAEDAGLTAWLAWILTSIPDDVRPYDLLTKLRQLDGHIRGKQRLRMLLPPHFGAEHVLGQVFRLPFPNATLFAAGMVLPSPRFLRIKYPDTRHRYQTWWRSAFSQFGD